jgi:radical SAM superfamily enzyme
MEEYFHVLGNILKLLPANMVIHRLTGDGPKSLLVEPTWTANKKYVLNSMNKYFKDNNIYQGCNFKK